MTDLAIVDESKADKAAANRVASAARKKTNSIRRAVTFAGTNGQQSDLTNVPEDLLEALAEFDIRGDGGIAKQDIIRAAKLYRDAKNKARRLIIAVVLLVIVLGASYGILAGVMFSVAESTKVRSKRGDNTGKTHK